MIGWITDIIQTAMIVALFYVQSSDRRAVWRALGKMAACLGYGKQDFFGDDERTP